MCQQTIMHRATLASYLIVVNAHQGGGVWGNCKHRKRRQDRSRRWGGVNHIINFNPQKVFTNLNFQTYSSVQCKVFAFSFIIHTQLVLDIPNLNCTNNTSENTNNVCMKNNGRVPNNSFLLDVHSFIYRRYLSSLFLISDSC